MLGRYIAIALNTFDLLATERATTTLKELELLRAICASIHCPMPPSISAS